MSSSLQTSRKTFPSKFLPWSDNISSGAPYRRITFSTSALATVVASWLASGIASTYFEKLSITVRMYKCPFLLLGCGPVRSMEIRSNGSPHGTGCRGPCLAGCPRQHWRQSVHCCKNALHLPTSPPSKLSFLPVTWSVGRPNGHPSFPCETVAGNLALGL